MATEAVLKKATFPEHDGTTRLIPQHVMTVFGVLYSCVKEVVGLVTGHVLLSLYCHRLSRTDEGRLTIRCQLVKHNWSNEMIHEKFQKFHDLLDMDVRTMEEVDAEFGSIVIKELCNKVFGILSDHVRAKILLLPKYKFKICRSYGKSLSALQQEVRKLRDFVNIIYREINEEFGSGANNYAKVITILNTTNQKLQTEIKDRHSTLQGLWHDNDVQILISAQQELSHQYETLQVLGPSQFLTGQNQLPKPILPSLRTGATERGPPVLVKDLLTTALIREDIGAAEVLLVGGAPGAGKTSLCYYLVKDWCNHSCQVRGLEHVDLVLLVEWAKVQSRDSLKNFLLNNILGHTKTRFPSQLSDASYLVKYDVLVLLDGFNACEENKEREFLQEVFQLFKGNCILMTTEPTALGYIEAVFLARNNLPSVTLSLCRLDASTRLSLAENACRKESQVWFRQFKEYHSKGLDRVLNHCREPATVLLYAALWRPNKPSPTTPSRLHKFILEGLCKEFFSSREQALSKWDQERLLHRLGELAWKQLCRNHRRVPLKIAKELEVEELLPVLFTVIVDNSTSPPKLTYSFASLSQQLYLAAIFLAKNIITDISYTKSLEEKFSIWEDYPELLLLTVGELCDLKCDPRTLTDVLRFSQFTTVRSEDFEYWCLLEQESCHNPLVTRFITDTLPADYWCLGSATVVPGLKLLARTSATVKSIVVDIPNDTEPYHIPELMEILHEMFVSFKRKINLELHLWKHDLYGGHQPSNQLLRVFAPWSFITNFTGEIGPEMDEAPVFDPHWIRTLRVRVASPAALHTLRGITRHLSKICLKVRVTLALPDKCRLEQLDSLDCHKLHLILEDVHEHNRSWAAGVVRCVAGRQPVSRLYLNTCSLSERSMADFFRKLRGVVDDKISLRAIQDVDNKTQRRLQHVAGCTISWL